MRRSTDKNNQSENKKNMHTENYLLQTSQWPQTGRHILAQYDQDSIIVYQAYRPSIALYALEHQRFGGDFSFARMSWIKPNFLWMMYRCGWATKEGQEKVLAVRLQRDFFEEVLAKAVASTYDSAAYADQQTWKQALASSEVRLQWDPDHAPDGSALARRAIQLGLRGEMLRRYATEAVLGIEDMTNFVQQQYPNAGQQASALLTPSETVFMPQRSGLATKLGLDIPPTA
jgi:hypothetical protein